MSSRQSSSLATRNGSISIFCFFGTMAGFPKQLPSYIVAVRSQSAPRLVVVALWRMIAIATLFLQPTSILDMALVTSLAAKPQKTKPHQWIDSSNRNKKSRHNHHHEGMLKRKRFLDGLFGSAVVATATTLLVPGIASAGIDVSSLMVETNPLDVFLGGNYYEDKVDLEGIDGRLSRRKYNIVEALPGGTTTTILPTSSKKKKPNFFEGLDRPVIIQGESTTISSSRDDAFELKGNLYLCNERGSTGCIVIDFSPLGGSSEAKGYWDAKENGIRFLEGGQLWLKQ